MEWQWEKVKGQKFELGRTINPILCDCVKCDFMNCPKNNYAARMERKRYTVDEYFNAYTEDILRINRYEKIEPVKLKLTYSLITELIDNCISFCRGTYWNANDYIFGDCCKEIELQTISRGGKITTRGAIRISDGNITDYGFSKSQRKLAESISLAIKKIIELADREFEKRDTSCIGWMDRNGRLYKCRAGQHAELAKKLGHTEWTLENMGWVKIFYDYDKRTGYYCMARKSPEQINRLIELGYMDND